MTENAVTTISAPTEVTRRPLDSERLIERWKEGRSADTLIAYTGDLAHFAQCSGAASAAAAIDRLLRATLGEANELGRAYRSAMADAGLAPATINRRLASLRSLVELANQFGYVPWRLSVKNVPQQTYRDTRGPKMADVVKVLKLAGQHPNKAKATRDVAWLSLMFGNGLRRGEVQKLEVSDYDPRGSRLRITGKGRREAEWITLARPTVRALNTWILHRGRQPGPLFLSIDRPGRMLERLKADGMHYLMLRWSERLGFPLRPHGLRHSAITAALDATNGDVRRARRFSRHRSIEVLLKYDDNREDVAGDITQKITQGVARAIKAVGVDPAKESDS